MTITPNVSLANYSTMRLGGTAAYVAIINSRDELKEAYLWAVDQHLPTIMIGGGSNIFWSDEGFPGLVMINKIMGYDVQTEDEFGSYLIIGGGEKWDSVVARSVASGLTGIEALSLIPGSVGGTPVQNVGAYGQEISQTLVSVEAFDTTTGQLAAIPAEACGLSYRNSTFKGEYRGRFFITAITLHLMKANPEPPYYSSVQEYINQHPVTTVTPAVIREAVIAIRNAKLPDPAVVANNGSFFANPIISEDTLAQLHINNPSMPYWPLDNGQVKIPAAWLIEQIGLKGFHDDDTGMATWPKQPLVLVNEHAKHTADLLRFRDRIVATVATKFGITLTQEPELLPITQG